MAVYQKRQGRISHKATLPKLPGIPMPRIPIADLPPIVRGMAGGTVKVGLQQPTTVPPEVLAQWPTMSLPEYLFQYAMVALQYHLGEDFYYQRALFGGTEEAGGTVADFVVTRDYPMLAVFINGMYWHYGRGKRVEEHDLAILRRIRTDGEFEPMVIDEDDLMQNAIYYTREAVVMRKDNSRYAGQY